MEGKNVLLQTLQDRYREFSRGQKKLADYILEHFDEAAFLTAAQLGKTAGVSESTAVRFASELGYSGFADLSRAMSELVRRQVNASSRMEDVYGDMERSKVLDEVLRTNMLRLEQTRQMISARSFDQAVSILENVRDIYVIGLRSSAPLAQYLYFHLRLIFNHVILVSSNSEHELLEQLLHVSSDDAVFGISFPRYSLRTVRMLEFAGSKNARIITLTDSMHAPVNMYSSCVLTAASDISSVAPSMTAPMGVVDALITALSVRNSAAMMKNLEVTARTLYDYQVSGSDDLDLLGEGVPLNFPSAAAGEKR